MSFAGVVPFAAVLTTGVATAAITNPLPNSAGAAAPTIVEGEPFSCAAWQSEGSEAVLAFPLPAVDLAGIGDWTSVALLHLVRTEH